MLETPFGEPPRTTIDRAPRALAVKLLAEVDDMAHAVPAGEREAAIRTVLAPLREVDSGVLAPSLMGRLRRPFAAVILGGILLRQTRVHGRRTIEILTPGDIVDVWCNEDDRGNPMQADHVVHRPARLAVLDDRFRVAARRWPGLHDVVYAQLSRQARRASRLLAVQHVPRVDDRIVAFFCDLADRVGRVGPEGILIDLALTHELLGEAVGARRPTITLALAELADSGALTRRRGGTWLIPHAHAGAA